MLRVGEYKSHIANRFMFFICPWPLQFFASYQREKCLKIPVNHSLQQITQSNKQSSSSINLRLCLGFFFSCLDSNFIYITTYKLAICCLSKIYELKVQSGHLATQIFEILIQTVLYKPISLVLFILVGFDSVRYTVWGERVQV